MPPLRARVLRLIREHGLVRSGDRVAVALSGGGDSVALLLLLHELQTRRHLPGTLAGVLHVNHGLRGVESARDEAFCRALADRLGLPIEVMRADAAAARAERRSVEAVARDARYRFFAEAAPRLSASVIATAHTLDDQAETVLLRLLRGTGGRGLGGIRLRRGPFVRPLLGSRREDLRRFLASRGEPFCEDSSNASLAIARNRVRHRLIPAIEEIAPGGIEALARFAALFAADEEYLETLVSERAASVVFSTARGVQLNTDALGHLSHPIARRMIRRALERVRPGRTFSARHLEDVLELCRHGVPGQRLDLPGVEVVREALAVVLEASAGRTAEAQPPPFAVPLPVPGRAEIPAARVSMTAAVFDEAPPDGMCGGDVAVLQASAVEPPLTVRSRRPGDRFQPFGAPGRRKLQDVLVDRKVPRALRDAVPIVVDAAGRIVWVAGVAIAEPCRVTTPSAGVVVLKVHR